MHCNPLQLKALGSADKDFHFSHCAEAETQNLVPLSERRLSSWVLKHTQTITRIASWGIAPTTDVVTSICSFISLWSRLILTNIATRNSNPSIVQASVVTHSYVQVWWRRTTATTAFVFRSKRKQFLTKFIVGRKNWNNWTPRIVLQKIYSNYYTSGWL